MNEKGNMDIAEQGKNTRFGAPNGPDPREAGKIYRPGSLRDSIRRIASADFRSVEEVNLDGLIKLFRPYPTHANVMAIRMWTKALQGDMKAIVKIDEYLDGKLVEKRAEAKVTLDELLVYGELKVGDDG